MLWDLNTGTCLDELKHRDCVAAVTFSPDGERLVVGCDDAALYVYTVVPHSG
jgi:WD40 repeat protein